MSRAFLVVLDSVGCGAAPDAAAVRAWLQSRVPEYRPRSADS